MSTAANQQIVFAYEMLRLTPGQIAEQFAEYGETEGSVLAVLANESPLYKETLRHKTSNASTDDELKELEAEYRLLARTTDNPVVKERCLKYLIEEKKGRNNIPAELLELKKRQADVEEADVTKRNANFEAAMIEINRKIEEAIAGRVINLSSTPKAIT